MSRECSTLKRADPAVDVALKSLKNLTLAQKTRRMNEKFFSLVDGKTSAFESAEREAWRRLLTEKDSSRMTRREFEEATVLFAGASMCWAAFMSNISDMSDESDSNLDAADDWDFSDVDDDVAKTGLKYACGYVRFVQKELPKVFMGEPGRMRRLATIRKRLEDALRRRQAFKEFEPV